MNTCDEIRDLFSLAAASALDPEIEDRVGRHVRDCASCTAELEQWQVLARSLRRLPTPQPAASVVEQARAAALRTLGEEAERRWNRNILVFLIMFAWTLTVLSWPLVLILRGGMESWFNAQLTPAWYAFVGITALGWVAGGAAAMVLALHQRRERRFA